MTRETSGEHVRNDNIRNDPKQTIIPNTTRNIREQIYFTNGLAQDMKEEQEQEHEQDKRRTNYHDKMATDGDRS